MFKHLQGCKSQEVAVIWQKVTSRDRKWPGFYVIWPEVSWKWLWSIGPHLPVKMYKRLPCKLPIHMASHDWPRNVNWILWYWQNPHKRSSVTIELSHCFCVFTPEANKGPEKTESRSPKTDRLNITPPPTHAQLQSSRWDRCATRESLWVYRPWSHKVEMGQKCEGMLWKHGYHNSYFVLSCFLSIHYSC